MVQQVNNNNNALLNFDLVGKSNQTDTKNNINNICNLFNDNSNMMTTGGGMGMSGYGNYNGQFTGQMGMNNQNNQSQFMGSNQYGNQNQFNMDYNNQNIGANQNLNMNNKNMNMNNPNMNMINTNMNMNNTNMNMNNMNMNNTNMNMNNNAKKNVDPLDSLFG